MIGRILPITIAWEHYSEYGERGFIDIVMIQVLIAISSAQSNRNDSKAEMTTQQMLYISSKYPPKILFVTGEYYAKTYADYGWKHSFPSISKLKAQCLTKTQCFIFDGILDSCLV